MALMTSGGRLGVSRVWLSALTVAAPRRLIASAAVRLDFGVASLPDPSKKRGEDAHIVSRGSATRAWAAVFDGVGGWSRHGIDPSRYSRKLARIVDVELHRQAAAGELRLRDALHAAATTNAEVGSCTACLAAVDTQTSLITTLNVGDSAVWVLRQLGGAATGSTGSGGGGGEERGPVFSLVHRSKVQQHAFNTPYQLGTQSRDSAADAELGVFAGRAGDVIVLASDGLFDNLSEADVRLLVSEREGKPAQHIADTLAYVAQRFSFDPHRQSPFELEAARHGIDFKGGKVDDTTVVVLRLLPDGPAADGERAL